jgi:hypothetical protein
VLNDHFQILTVDGKLRSRNQASDETSPILWAAHPKPQQDELFSSWLARVAWSNQIKLHTFCDIIWRKRAIWNRDIDKSATREVTESLARGTGTDTEVAWQTTLASYKSWVYASHTRVPLGESVTSSTSQWRVLTRTISPVLGRLLMRGIFGRCLFSNVLVPVESCGFPVLSGRPEDAKGYRLQPSQVKRL